MSNYLTDSFTLTGATSQGLPGISAPLILQQFIPVVCFPSHFQFLHSSLSELDVFHRKLAYPELDNDCENFMNNFYNYLSNNVEVIVSSLDSESLHLFILHLMPYLTNSSTSFDTILTSFDVIAKYLSHNEVLKIFSPLLQDLYDQTSLDPQHKAQILHRPYLNTLIHRFGLAHFRERFISHVVEAVINPNGVHSKKEQKRGQNLTTKEDHFHDIDKEGQSMATGETKQQLSLLLDIEPEYSSEEEGDDMMGETYTSLLVQTPVQVAPKHQIGSKPDDVKESRTYSICSVDDVISMEPIAVMSPASLSTIVDGSTNKDGNLLPYQSSPDITTSNFAFSLVINFVINF